MTPLATIDELRRWDTESARLGLPEYTLMENAARAALSVLRQYKAALTGCRIVLFMGGGNNGGDAACLARHLLDAKARVLVLHTKPLGKLNGAARQHARLSKVCGVEFRLLPVNPEVALDRLSIAWQNPDIIIDGLLGTGFTGTLRPPMTALIQAINAAASQERPPFILALDTPSGLNAMTGPPSQPDATPIVCAAATVTFAAATPGLVLPRARAYTGALHVREIGIPRCVYAAHPPHYVLLDSRCATLLPPLPAQVHKNRLGHVLIIGGMPGMSGAAHLAARAALRTGAGLVSVAAPAASLPLICACLPEAMSVPCGEQSWPECMDAALLAAIGKASALLIGPGMGAAPSLLKDILSLPTRPPALCDADALNTLAAHPALRTLLRTDDICTPHPAEAARLLKATTADIQTDRFAALRALNALAPCAMVLKGAGTLVGQADHGTCIAPWDIPTLAVAGSGDVLAGCAAALLARGMTAHKAALVAVGIHARAGMLCAAQYPLRGALAGELADTLPTAMATLHALPNLADA